MKYSAPAVAATLACVGAPTPILAYSFGPGRPSIVVRRPALVYGSPMASMLRQQQALVEEAFRERKSLAKSFLNDKFLLDYSPNYQITDNDNSFAVALDIPGIAPENIDITIQEGNVLVMKGSREFKDDNGSSKYNFYQSFSLDQCVEIDKFTANLENGVLTVAAPKDMKKLQDEIQRIPITVPKESEATTSEKVQVNDQTSTTASIAPNAASGTPSIETTATDSSATQKVESPDANTEEIQDLDDEPEKKE